MSKFSLSNWKYTRYNFLANYKVTDEVDVYLEHVSRDNEEHFKAGAFNAGAYFKPNGGKSQYAFRHTYNPTNVETPFNIQAALITEYSDKNSLKAKIDIQSNVQLAWKHNCSKNISSTLGTRFKIFGAEDRFYNKDSRLPIPLGLQLEFNY